MELDLIRFPGTEPRDQIVLALRRQGTLSRAEIARATGLAKSTVSDLVGELVQTGIVVSTTATRKPARNGRPGTGVTLNPRAGVFVGIDFGFRHVRGVVADVAHRVLATSERPVPIDYSLDEALAVAGQIVDNLLDEAYFERKAVLGIGVAIPGLIDQATGTVIGTSMVPTWSGANVREILANRFEQDVMVDNDSNCAALGEHLWGAGRGANSMAYLKLHSGIGGALIINGELVRGVAGGAGEFGHITVDPQGDVCRCGGRGCLELHLGIPAVLSELRHHGDIEPTLGELLRLARDGDPACRRVLADAGEAAGRALGFVANIVAPERVVIGGALSEAQDAIMVPLEASFSQSSVLTRGGTADHQRIAVAAGLLGRNASALGAVALVLTHLGVEQAR